MLEKLVGQYLSYQESLFIGETPFIPSRGKVLFSLGERIAVNPERDRWYMPSGLLKNTVPVDQIVKERELRRYHGSAIYWELDKQGGTLVFHLARLDERKMVTVEDPVIVGILHDGQFIQARDFSLTRDVMAVYAQDGWNLHKRKRTYKEAEYWKRWFDQDNKLLIYSISAY